MRALRKRSEIRPRGGAVFTFGVITRTKQGPRDILRQASAARADLIATPSAKSRYIPAGNEG